MQSRYNRRLTLCPHVDVYSGYGQIGMEIFSRFDKKGIFCSIRPFNVSELFGTEIPLEVRSHFVNAVQPEEWELWIRTPKECPTPGKRVVFLTMHEWTRLPKLMVENINRAEIIIVPSQWCFDNFKASGITKPIYVVPLGFDPLIFQPSPMPPTDKIIFGCAGRVAHGPVRKGIGKTIELFKKAFPNNDNVRLHVKVHEDCNLDPVNDNRIKITRAHLEWYQLANWFRDIHCFVSLAGAEGFGLLQLQALASGRHLMAPNYSGLTEFMTNENSHHVPMNGVTEEEGWANFVETDVIGRWKNIATSIGHSNVEFPVSTAKSIQHFTWQETASELESILESHRVFSEIV